MKIFWLSHRIRNDGLERKARPARKRPKNY